MTLVDHLRTELRGAMKARDRAAVAALREAIAAIANAETGLVSDSATAQTLSEHVAGAAAAGVTPLAMAWIGDSVPYERRQEVLARLIGATTLGMIAGQWLGGVLADTLGWRSAFAMLSACKRSPSGVVHCR